ncbi:hypothetical protein FRZ61_14350 [Hypericibacter adhaerens]|uniref:Uncharacterized protein n=1 Tax=Hypericibacter adhaerens TaxID=2602016 RepID=A0A5J6N3M8_9PROT|nr:hypothetical protein FRZ61_14350 [Hypericibacter adhaerens]
MARARTSQSPASAAIAGVASAVATARQAPRTVSLLIPLGMIFPIRKVIRARELAGAFSSSGGGGLSRFDLNQKGPRRGDARARKAETEGGNGSVGARLSLAGAPAR